jgi:Cu2+-exporting ATPase
MAADFQKRFWISLVITLPILVLSPMLQSLVGLREAIRFPGDFYVLFGLASAVFWYGGWPFLKGFCEELKSHRPGMMTLISVAVATAYLYSIAVVFGLAGKMFFWELATLVDIMLLGHWIEMKSVMGASKALEELAKLMPDGSVKDVPLGELAVNDKVLIKPGEKIPADGVIVAGESSVNEAMLTGESTPAAKKTGVKVIGGAINGEGSLTIEVKGVGKDSFLSQVIDLVKQAQESKSKTQDLANTAALWLTIVALGGGVITLVVWLAFMGKDFAFAIERTVTVMVIACPHALGSRRAAGGGRLHGARREARPPHPESRCIRGCPKARSHHFRQDRHADRRPLWRDRHTGAFTGHKLMIARSVMRVLGPGEAIERTATRTA